MRPAQGLKSTPSPNIFNVLLVITCWKLTISVRHSKSIGYYQSYDHPVDSHRFSLINEHSSNATYEKSPAEDVNHKPDLTGTDRLSANSREYLSLSVNKSSDTNSTPTRLHREGNNTDPVSPWAKSRSLKNGRKFDRIHTRPADTDKITADLLEENETVYNANKKNESEVSVISQDEDVEPLLTVRRLRRQLEEEQSTHMHTRSVINEMQEKLDAQAADLVLFKDELTRLRAEQDKQREELNFLMTKSSDLTWALADVKQSQSQASDDFIAFKQVQHETLQDLNIVAKSQERHGKELKTVKLMIQEQNTELKLARESELDQNNTLNVIRDIVMNNAVDVRMLQKNNSWIRIQLEELKEQLSTESDILRKYVKTQEQNNNSQKFIEREEQWKSTNSNEWIKPSSNLSQNLQTLPENERGNVQIELEIDSKFRPTVEHQDFSFVRLSELTAFKTDVLSRFEEQKSSIQRINDKCGNTTKRLDLVEENIEGMKEENKIGFKLLQLQQSVINLTRQVFEGRDVSNKNDDTQQSSNSSDDQMLVEMQHNSDLMLFYNITEKLIESLSEHIAQSSYFIGELEERMKTMIRRVWQSEQQLDTLMGLWLNLSMEKSHDSNSSTEDLLELQQVLRDIIYLNDTLRAQENISLRFAEQLEDLKQRVDENKAHPQEEFNLKRLHQLSNDMSEVKREQMNFVQVLPKTCSEVLSRKVSSPFVPLHSGSEDGIYLIKPPANNHSLAVYCKSTNDWSPFGMHRVAALESSPIIEEPNIQTPQDIRRITEEDYLDSSSMWTVIQRRSDGKEEFRRNWDDYKYGFGQLTGDFWLGNEYMHQLTAHDGPHRLRIELLDQNGRFWIAEYDSFYIGSEQMNYQLNIGQYSGNATDALRYSALSPFSAPDRDNDVSTTHCADFYQSGWWYKHCHYCNLNGAYTSGIVWYHSVLEEWLQLRHTVMMIT